MATQGRPRDRVKSQGVVSQAGPVRSAPSIDGIRARCGVSRPHTRGPRSVVPASASRVTDRTPSCPRVKLAARRRAPRITRSACGRGVGDVRTSRSFSTRDEGVRFLRKAPRDVEALGFVRALHGGPRGPRPERPRRECGHEGRTEPGRGSDGRPRSPVANTSRASRQGRGGAAWKWGANIPRHPAASCPAACVVPAVLPVPSPRLERGTYCLGGSRSIHLSYEG